MPSMRRLALALATTFTATIAAHAAWTETDPSEGRIRLGYERESAVADDYWSWINVDGGNTFRCEQGWWRNVDMFVEARFCWAEDRGGWPRDSSGTDDFLGEYNLIYDAGVTEVADGPTIATVYGPMPTIRFDINEADDTVFGQCIGFRTGIEPKVGLDRGYFAKQLDVYVCDGFGLKMTDQRVLAVLQALGVDGEFDRLVP